MTTPACDIALDRLCTLLEAMIADHVAGGEQRLSPRQAQRAVDAQIQAAKLRELMGGTGGAR